MNGGIVMPPRPPKPQTDGIEKPKRLRDYPAYLLKRAGGFLKRLFYIVSLVWDAAPPALVAMALLCLFDGLLPVVGAYISKDLLNSVASLIGSADLGSVGENLFVTMRPLLYIFLAYFIYLFLKKILSSLLLHRKSQPILYLHPLLLLIHIK